MENILPKDLFHPAVATWFGKTFADPTACQLRAWPTIKQGQNTLITAPTGSGKTLAAFLAAIDDLVRLSTAQGYLEDRTQVLYVSPLKALSNDIDKNLQQPLAGIRDELLKSGIPDPGIRTAVRSGDTPPSERERMRRQPPHILVTTPESFYLLLTSDSGRDMLSTVQTVIVDEIHALANNKRGAHLALSLERLEALTLNPPVRIGLSATQKPIERVASFLCGASGLTARDCKIIDTGFSRDRDLAIEMPRSPLQAVMAAEVWSEVYDQLADLIRQHTTTLIFVNTRRLAERAARHLAERLGEDVVTSHHGSLAKEHRLDAEQRLKAGQLQALIATASMELGIDIGDVDLVCQIGSPRSISALIQRVGRSGHAVGAMPKGRLFPTSRDELVECTALLDAVQNQELDTLELPHQPLDVLAQQIVAEAACREWQTDELFARLTQAYPYRKLTRDQFDAVIAMLAEGFSTRRGRRGAYIHYDAVNRRLRGRKSARITALTNGGAIPEQFDYDVILEPEGVQIGTLNEDFAFESLAGDIFQLGNTSYRILRVENGVVRVQDAKGQPPNIPFWFGEAPGRSDELSQAVSRLREEISDKLDKGVEKTIAGLIRDQSLPQAAATQLTEYLGASKIALGELPTQQRIIFERFFDEAGDMHLVIHSSFGSRLNRAWGLALRKRFCRQFNFELQAAALEDCIVLSLGPTHSFPLEEVKNYLSSKTVREVLIQALLAAPMFPSHWRWVANIALAVKRNRNGKRIPAQWQRSDAEDLVAVVFPDQLACLENIAGDREIPDHPLVNQAIADCLHEVMDIDGLETLLKGIEGGEIEVITRDLNAPSPLAQEILSARPYAFLDDAPAEERRTLAVQSRGLIDMENADELARLDPLAIDKVKHEAWPEPRDVDELHDALVVMGFLTDDEVSSSPMVAGWKNMLQDLSTDNRVTQVQLNQPIWVAAERLVQFQTIFPDAPFTPTIQAAGSLCKQPWSRDTALREIIRSRMEGLGPVTADRLATDIQLPSAEIEAVLLALQTEGFAVQGHFTNPQGVIEWCDRRLLARMHRYTLSKLRQEIEPVSAQDFMRFLLAWQRIAPSSQGDGAEALVGVIDQLEGFEAPVVAWESELLPARIWAYTPSMLDDLNLSGRVRWARLTPAKSGAEDSPRGRTPATVRNSPIGLLPRAAVTMWRALSPANEIALERLSSPARAIVEVLRQEGALFFDEIAEEINCLPAQLEQALAELVSLGWLTSDNFNGLRALMVPSLLRSGSGIRRHRGRRKRSSISIEYAGRWSLIRTPRATNSDAEDAAAHIAMVLLRRYGVVFRALLQREANWLPPWRDLLRVYRRLEAQGKIRGGRFVSGFTGEQFALSEAVGSLRKMRNKALVQEFVVVNATDPLNLAGIATPGPRVAAFASNRILYCDGLCAAVLLGDKVELRDPVDGLNEWKARNMLLRGYVQNTDQRKSQ